MTSTWNALTGLPSIFPRQDWLKFSLLHQYRNALGRLERTPSKKRAFYALMPSSWMATGLFFLSWSEALWAARKIRDVDEEVSVGGCIDGRTRGCKIHQWSPSAWRLCSLLKTSESADLQSSYATSTRAWTNNRTGPILNSNQSITETPGTI